MPPGLYLGPHTCPEVRWRGQAHGTGLRGVTPLAYVPATVARRGGMATSGSNGGYLGVGRARTLIRSVPSVWAITSM